jgi:hypothetical protein
MRQLKRWVFIEHANRFKGKCFSAHDYRVIKII